MGRSFPLRAGISGFSQSTSHYVVDGFFAVSIVVEKWYENVSFIFDWSICDLVGPGAGSMAFGGTFG
jgi:hypothetical protein